MSNYNVNNSTINNLLSWIAQEEIAIPEIQRPFVWKASKVRDLIDSLYKDYPVGYIITWQNPDVRLKDGSVSRGKKILIDGQQRVTALMAAISGLEVLDINYRKKKIRISFNPIEEKFEVLNPAITKDPKWIPDISSAFDNDFDLFGFIEKYCLANPLITKGDLNKTMQNLLKIKYNTLGIIELSHNLDIETVTEIFIRINSAGVVLSQADFAMSKITSNDQYGGPTIRKTIDYFSNLMKNPEVFENIEKNDIDFIKLPHFKKLKWLKNYHTNIYEPGYSDLLRVSFTYKYKRGKISDLVSLLSGRDFETRENRDDIVEASFEMLEEGVMSFIDETNFKRFIMIVKSTGIIHHSLVRSQNVLNFAYSLFLLLREMKIEGNTINRVVRKWIVLSILTGRYSSSPESQFDFDIKRFAATDDPLGLLKNIEEGVLSEAYWDNVLISRLDSSVRSSPYFILFLMSQVVANDVSFLSKSITIQHLIEERGDIHHIFPKKYLQSNGYNRQGMYNQIGNYVFIEQVINLKIKDQSPESYMRIVENQCNNEELKIGELNNLSDLKENMKMNAIPVSLFNLKAANYEEFLVDRRKLMADKIKTYYQNL